MDNQDRWFADPSLGLFIVADGMGGHAAGELAAQLVVDVLSKLIRQVLSAGKPPSPDELSRAVGEQVGTLSDLVREETRGLPAVHGTGATVVLALVEPTCTIVAHAGDSRAYIFRQGALRRLTRDHTVAQLLVDHQAISTASVARHPASGRLTRYVGMEQRLVADRQVIEFLPGDLLLLCSDGLHGQVSDAQIASALGRGRDIGRMGQRLLDAVNRVGAPDNVTLLLIARGGRGEVAGTQIRNAGEPGMPQPGV